MGEATTEAQLYSGGALIGSSKSIAAWGPTSFGGAADSWGAPLDDADVNSSGFGVAIRAIGTDDGPGITFFGARMTVYYNIGGDISPGSSTSGHFIFNWIF